MQKISKGAIPKNVNIMAEQQFTEDMNKLNKDLTDFHGIPNINRIVNHLMSNHKIMIIMRGAPGAGKSFLAKKLIDFTHAADNDYNNFIFSSDDYFYNAHNNKYQFQPEKLPYAHDFNQKRVRKKAIDGWSPIIVDNTNIQVWEMLPYVKIAVQNGYLIEMLSPKNPWSNSAYHLSCKNRHGVSKTKIANILNNFEPINNSQILQAIKPIKYSTKIPQMRRLPKIISKHYDDYDANNENHLRIFQKNNDVQLKNYSDSIEKNLKTVKKLNSLKKPRSQQSITTNDLHLNNQHENTAVIVSSNAASSDYQQKKNILKTEEIEIVNVNSSSKFHIHSLGCPNENKVFHIIRQIYPEKNANQLWSLFENYNGDADLIMDIMFNEGNENLKDSDDSNDDITKFQCNCNQSIKLETKTIDRNELEEIEKISITAVDRSSIEKEMNNTEKMLKINLGHTLVEQLETMFGSETTLLQNSIKKYETDVFMPESMAKQLYALWMESLYNQVEEEKQQTIIEDEYFAKILQDNEIEYDQLSSRDFKNTDCFFSNDTDKENFKNTLLNSTESTLIESSDFIKLHEQFPEVEKNMLQNIFEAHNNDFNETVKVLKNSLSNDESSNEAYINKIIENSTNTIELNQNEGKKRDFEGKGGGGYAGVVKRHNERNIIPSEVARKALQDFEENRNLAAHYSQLKAECFEKAKDAIQRNNTSVAVYYAQIADLHKTKIDMYNHKAASCIIEVQDLTQKNPDCIDLHYLHTIEAMECLDIFLDTNIKKLRNLCRSYKYIFIITGRGLHSSGGISAIKNNVKTRLKERNLKWSEVNPGLLKVKLFSSSRYSKNS